MSNESPIRSFSELVTQQLAPDTRELWLRMADTFEREGPEEVKTYLDAQRDQLENNIRDRLEQFTGG